MQEHADEIGQEVKILQKRTNDLAKLKSRYAGKFLMSSTGDEAREVFYEHCLIDMAMMQGSQQLTRLSGSNLFSAYGLESSDISGYVNDKLKQVNEVGGEGWEELKEHFFDVGCIFYQTCVNTGDYSLLPDFFGLPADFTFKGVPIMRRSLLIPGQWQSDKFQDLLNQQLDLIPNEPGWVYPRLPELQQIIENAGRDDADLPTEN